MIHSIPRFSLPLRLPPRGQPVLFVGLALIRPGRDRRSYSSFTARVSSTGAGRPGFQQRSPNTSYKSELGRMQYSSTPKPPRVPLTLSQRLERDVYADVDCSAALRGEKLPISLGHEVVRLCVVAGIRRHIDFAHSPKVVALASHPGQEIFARARNASLIMNDEIPPEDAMRSETYPYCIWYPKIAKEETYRTLAQRYPAMRYQVGRACAVAGYVQLYHELNLLPDVSIAEEARENRTNPGAQEIFKHIMAAPMRYLVMNDYTRTIHLDKPTAPAFLNADTAVLTSLTDRRRKYKYDKWHGEPWCKSNRFNITEDWNIDEHTSHWDPPELTTEELKLLNGPLPLDLPTMNKTLLILYAAANGDVDRYVRLRRQFPEDSEDLCLVRGCYHSTAMATWLAKSPEVIKSLRLDDDDRKRLWRAIHARRVMDGSISHLLDPATVPDDELPYWIWYPKYPSWEVLLELAKARPAMRQQCLRASIAADYWSVFDKIMDSDRSFVPDGSAMAEAKANSSVHYRDHYQKVIQQRIESLGLDGPPNGEDEEVGKEWQSCRPYVDANPRHGTKGTKLRDTNWEVCIGEDLAEDYPYGFYEGYDLTLDKVNSVLSMSEEERKELKSMGCMCPDPPSVSV